MSKGGASSKLGTGRPTEEQDPATVPEVATEVDHKHRQVLFKVLHDATKPENKAAAVLTFKVEIQDTTANLKGKTTHLGRLKRRVLKPALASKRIASEDLDAAVQSVAG